MAHDPARERSVGADMERIFGPAGRSNAARDLDDASWVPTRPPALRRPRRGILHGTAIAAPVALVFALGLLSAHGGDRSAELAPVEARVAPTIPPVVSRGDAAQVVAAVVERTRPASVARPAAHPLVQQPIRRSVARAVAASAPTGSGRVRVWSTPPASDRSAEPCARGDEDDRCIYQDVVAADRRLRGAYADAVRDGAPRAELVAIRRRWRQARDMSLEAPDETIRRYDRLADDLGGPNAAAPR